MLIKVVREKKIGDAVPSKIYIDGEFFGYGLENDLYKIPAGTYAAYSYKSPTFGANKIYLSVPGRTSILFHGGNTADNSRGCILTGSRRDGATISGDNSDALYSHVNSAYDRGESIAVKVTGELNKMVLCLFAAGVAAILYHAVKG